MYYEINQETYAVNVYDGRNPEPFWYQPNYPNGDTFDSYAEAEEWAKLAVLSHDPDYGFYPPNGKGIAPEAKPTAEELRMAKLAQTGLTVDDLKALLGL
jgi:hypothetical protein